MRRQRRGRPADAAADNENIGVVMPVDNEITPAAAAPAPVNTCLRVKPLGACLLISSPR
jgi:hypothetical protein